MEKFLEETKDSLEHLSGNSKVHVVLGNEACDLDSAVAALVYAIFLSKTTVYPDTLVVPLLNIRRSDLALRSEVTYFLKKNDIPLELILFRDSIDLKALYAQKNLSLTLVDHNQLSGDDKPFQDSVVEIIDHHRFEPAFEQQSCKVTVEPVGSCCTLIADKLLDADQSVVDRQISLLLYGTILLDTVNLNEAAKRVTATDRSVAENLKALLPEVDRDALFQSLHAAKFDVSGLDMDDLLRKDLKTVSNSTMSVAVASLCVSLENLLRRQNAEVDLQKFATANTFQIVVLMGLEVHPVSQEVKRQLAVYSSVQAYREQIVDLLEVVSRRGPRLNLQPIESPFLTVILYCQNNIAASRKAVLPVFKTFLLGDQSPSVTGHTCNTSNDCSGCCKGNYTNSGGGCSAEDEHLDNFDPLAAESEDVVLPDVFGNSASHLHVLGAGDPISHAGSSQSSSNQNSCPYTPQNSCTDGGLELDPYARQILPSFNSREMMERIESKRGKLRGYDGGGGGGGGDDSGNASYPFTPKNSFVDGSFEAYVRNVPSFDSGDLLLKVNEKVASFGSKCGSAEEPAGSISVDVPQIGVRKATLAFPSLRTPSAPSSPTGPSVQQDCRVHEDGSGDRPVAQQCPEAVSFSDRLEKSDDRMDTSETPVSSEKTSPIPNDTEIQTSCMHTSSVTANMAPASTVATNLLTTTTTTTTNTNNVQQTQKICTNGETSPVPQLRTDSSASVSSIQTDVDLDLASNYQTETVDFPDSPRQLKFLTQSSLDMQGLSLEETVPEEDEETEEQNDEVFRTVLSPSGDGVSLKKDKGKQIISAQSAYSSISIEALRESPSAYHTCASNSDLSLSLESLELESSESFEDSILVISHEDDDQKCDVFVNTTSDEPGANYSADSDKCCLSSIPNASAESLNVFDRVRALASKFSTPKSKKDLSSVFSQTLSRLGEDDPSSIMAESQCSFASRDKTFDNSVNMGLISKVLSCVDREKIMDVYTLSKTFHEILSREEAEEILNNSNLYAEYFFSDIFEALHLSTICFSDSSTADQCGVVPEDASGCTNFSKKLVSINKSRLDRSIVDRFAGELYTRAVFEGAKALKRIPKSVTKQAVHHLHDDINGSSLPYHLNETSVSITSLLCEHHTQEAFFVESADHNTSDKMKRRLPCSIRLDDTVSSLDSDDVGSSSTSPNVLEKPVYCHTKPRRTSSSSEPERPNTLISSDKKKRKIRVNPDILNAMEDKEDEKSLSSLSNRSDGDILSPVDDLITPDDIETPDDLDDSITDVTDPIPEMSAAEERDEERRWRTCVIGGVQRKIDMKVIEPYKKVLSHGGYYGPKRSAIIVFSSCYLPDHSRKDYDYVMDNLFLYVLTTLDQLVAEDYVLVYLHGALDRSNMPSFGWLKRCYQMIDRRLRKNLKGLYLVHPTFWLKAMVVMTRPFVSSKFARKLQFVNSLQELAELVPIDQVSIPDKVKQLDFEMMIKEKKKQKKFSKANSKDKLTLTTKEISDNMPNSETNYESGEAENCTHMSGLQ